MENIDEQQIITVDLNDVNQSTVVDLTTTFVDELDDFKGETKKFREETEEFKKQAADDIKSLQDRIRVYAEVYDQIQHSYANFLEFAKHVEVSVPYEKGTYLRAYGYSKTVSLYDLLGQNLITIPKI